MVVFPGCFGDCSNFELDLFPNADEGESCSGRTACEDRLTCCLTAAGSAEPTCVADPAECVTNQDEGQACVVGGSLCRDGLVCNLLEVGTYPDEIGVCRSCSVLCADADGPGEGCPEETTCECCPRGQRCETLGSWQRCVAYTPDGGGVDAGTDAAPDVGLTWDAPGAADGDAAPDAELGVADSLAGGA